MVIVIVVVVKEWCEKEFKKRGINSDRVKGHFLEYFALSRT